MVSLSFYNSLTRRKEDFTPIDADHVRLYACGPTVYSFAHIGNARMAVVFDLLARLLRRAYPRVTYVSNITDIEDKIINAAREQNLSIADITRKYADIYNQDMAALGVLPPDEQPLATGHVDEMIALMEALIDRNHAYAQDGHVLFHVPSYEAYGRLSGRSRDEQIAGARVEIASYKKDPADFVLWKPSSGDEPGWDSPWGFGRPGWHIECSAMAEKHLGLPFDIHGGGADLKFPHHENEIAQSCGAHDLPPEGFAKVWMHNGFVTVSGEKMSKSLGNVLLVHDLIADTPGDVLRLVLLSAHYRKPLDWSDQAVHQAEKLYEKINKALNAISEELKNKRDPALADSDVLAALSDDLNTPLALTHLAKLAGQVENNYAGFLGALELLGIEGGQLVAKTQSLDDPKIMALLEERTNAKAKKDYARADAIRDELLAQGIMIEDTPEGPVWRAQ